jgi:hypothetical protein
MKVEMTGKEDLEAPWKYAIGGFPGSGKTMLASTAPNPLFVFFQENPRLKSIASRYIPHVKVVNDDDSSVLEKMLAISHHLAIAEHEYETLVIDTGDELFQGIKEARRIQNGGEFKPGDWDWLGDTYRELLTGLIDLPIRVIVLFHVKNTQEGDDGLIVREFLLQGAAKDQAAGWFDEVFMFDNFEVENEEGETVTKRGLLTQTSRLHPWLKDHSGNMPRWFELSSNFVGDIGAIERILNTNEVESSREDLGQIQEYHMEKAQSGDDTPIPTPEDLQEKKQEKATEDVPPDPRLPETKDGGDPGIDEDVSAIEKAAATAKEVLNATEVEDETPLSSEVETEPEEGKASDITVLTPPADEASTEDTSIKCAECGEEVDNEDLINMSRAKYKEVLCRPHFKARMRGTS